MYRVAIPAQAREDSTSRPVLNTATSPVENEITEKKVLEKISYVARRLDIPVSTAYEYTRQNRIGGLVRIGRHIRFDKVKFDAWLEAGGESAQAQEIT